MYVRDVLGVGWMQLEKRRGMYSFSNLLLIYFMQVGFILWIYTHVIVIYNNCKMLQSQYKTNSKEYNKLINVKKYLMELQFNQSTAMFFRAHLSANNSLSRSLRNI